MRPGRNDFDLRGRYSTAAPGFLLLWLEYTLGELSSLQRRARKPVVPVSARVAGSAAETERGEAASTARDGRACGFMGTGCSRSRGVSKPRPFSGSVLPKTNPKTGDEQ
jgi:hypothetical protein